MGTVLSSRRAKSTERLDALKARLIEAEGRVKGKACVYVTGSFARGDASERSDLDVFIVVKGTDDDRKLSRLDEIRVKADLIKEADAMRFPPFSGDGYYLNSLSLDRLVKTLGKPEDDQLNTFTARMLLLLESAPLLEKDVHKNAIEEVIFKYWGDYEDHRDSFAPVFLANDVLRLWRTFCVNYEARTNARSTEKEKKEYAKRKLMNYKLKHSRLLTCHSALAYLSALYATHGTVHPEQAIEMVGLSPTARLEWVGENLPHQREPVDDMLDSYEAFLQQMDADEDELIERFADRQKRQAMPDANRFGDLTFTLLEKIGRSNSENSRFHRLLMV
jgi:predicted nucleotidyltransferase